MKKFRYDIVVNIIDDNSFYVNAIDRLNKDNGYQCAYKMEGDINLYKIVSGLNACLHGVFSEIYNDDNAEIIETLLK
jgi:hypothetical protein